MDGSPREDKTPVAEVAHWSGMQISNLSKEVDLWANGV